jgi:diguanylate cyclase (GGDEF)-like protein
VSSPPVTADDHAGASDVGRLRLRSLVHLARAMAEPRPFEDLVEVAAHEIRFALEAATVSVCRLEREHGIIRALVNVGDLGPGEQMRPRDETYQLADYPLLTGLVEEAAPWVFDANAPGADPAEASLLRQLGKTYAIGAPILLEGRVWGELYATRTAAGRPFDDDDVALVEALAAVMASGVTQATRVSLVERLAYEDPLTGLANRRAVDLRLEQALDARALTGRPVSVVMADVNGLKVTNDERGHEAGDRVLTAVGDAIAFAVSRVPGGLAGRIGGDEFCIVLDGVDGDEAIRVAQSMMDRLDDGPFPGRLSCGVATTLSVPAQETVSGRQLLRWADEAQYTAKRAHLQVPVLAGRDTMMLPTTERRRLRGGVPGPARTSGTASAAGAELAEVAALDHAPDLALQALSDGLSALAAAGRGDGSGDASANDTSTSGTATQLRLVRLLDAVCDTLDASGWVLSRTDGPEQVSRTVAFAQARESSRPEAAVPLTGSWFARARDEGVLARRGEVGIPLAELRASVVVAAAAADVWLLEILADDGDLDGVPQVLRALAGVALTD